MIFYIINARNMGIDKIIAFKDFFIIILNYKKAVCFGE